MNYQFNEVREPVVVDHCELCNQGIVGGSEGVRFDGMAYCSIECFINDLKESHVLEDI